MSKQYDGKRMVKLASVQGDAVPHVLTGGVEGQGATCVKDQRNFKSVTCLRREVVHVNKRKIMNCESQFRHLEGGA